MPASGYEISTSDRKSILHKIADAERQIASLNRQREKAEATLRLLRERLALHNNGNPRQPTIPATVVASTTRNLTPDDKVALFQYHPRQEGNTVFLDDALEPFPDQWDFLASLVPIPAEKVESIAMEATTCGQVIGLQIADTGEDVVDASPWLTSPSWRPKHIVITGPIPLQVRGVLSQRLYVENGGLPSALINQIKRLAAFQNPEFYKKQNLRLSTALTPWIILPS